MTKPAIENTISGEDIARALISLGEDPSLERIELIAGLVDPAAPDTAAHPSLLKAVVDDARAALAHAKGFEDVGTLEAGKALAEAAVKAIDGRISEWELNTAMVGIWAYADVTLPGVDKPLRVGASGGGVVSVNGDQILARVVTQGAKVGPQNHTADLNGLPLVEFYAGKKSDSPRGKWLHTSHLKDLREYLKNDATTGHLLGETGYQLTASQLNDVVTWAGDRAHVLEAEYRNREGVAVRNGGPLYIEGFDEDEEFPQWPDGARTKRYETDPWLKISKPGQLLEQVLAFQEECIERMRWMPVNPRGSATGLTGYGLEVTATVGGARLRGSL